MVQVYFILNNKIISLQKKDLNEFLSRTKGSRNISFFSLFSKMELPHLHRSPMKKMIGSFM